MLKKRMTYTDFNGVERTEDFYFNFTEAEVAEMEFMTGGLEVYVNRIVDAKDPKEIVTVFKDLLLRAYGKKSDDGKRFVKSPEISAEFASTKAYSDLFMALATNPSEAADFFKYVAPQPKSDSKVLTEA